MFGGCIYLSYKLFSFTHTFKFAPAECVGPFVLLTLLAITHCVISRFGYNGATKDNLKHILWFQMGLAGHMICEIAIGIWSIILNRKAAVTSTVMITDSFNSFISDNYHKSSWESLQQELQCCGIDHPNDYKILNPSSGFIPTACCETDPCTRLFQHGCKDLTIQSVKKLLLDITFISFGSALFMMLGIVCFCYLRKAIKQQTKAEISEKRRAPGEASRMTK
ncbi:leukocyte surface antigen CD53-like isoform X2 [Photinus pyralis]|nr:leukocyte surface antigen CD53-like isoform X2 [Photinus pyralis]